MKRLLASLATIALFTVLAGCGKKFSPGCKSSAGLTAPWAGYDLPIAEGRVCESSSDELKLEFVDDDKSKWAAAIEQSVTKAGFTKDKCPSYCIYTKDTQRLQVIVGNVGAKWVTVSMHMTTAAARAEATDKSREPEKKEGESKVTEASATGVDGFAECRSYFKRLAACPPAKGPLSRDEEAKIKKRELQEKLDRGTRPEIIRKTCETFDKMLKC